MNQTAGLLLNKLRENRKNGVVITLKGTLPSQNGEILVTTQPKELLGMPTRKAETNK